jgi:hypothetical protein
MICRLGYLSFFFLLIFSLQSRAQCSYFPADCPSDTQLPDSADRFGNPVLPVEVSMEIRLHNYFSDLMKKQADKKNWQVYQFDESAGSGYLNGDRSGPLGYQLRPPHSYEISFVFIINPDSLRAWQEWQKEFLTNMQEEIKKLTSNNEYSSFNRLQEVYKNKTERFRNSCMIRVKIEVNPEEAIASSITDNIQQTGELHIPHAVVAFRVHNNQTDEKAIFDLNQFNRCNDLAFLLFGNWNITPDGYQYYRAAYHSDKKNIDLVSSKTIHSEKVRTIAVHVEGSPNFINQFLQALDTDKISELIIQ